MEYLYVCTVQAPGISCAIERSAICLLAASQPGGPWRHRMQGKGEPEERGRGREKGGEGRQGGREADAGRGSTCLPAAKQANAAKQNLPRQDLK